MDWFDDQLGCFDVLLLVNADCFEYQIILYSSVILLGCSYITYFQFDFKYVWLCLFGLLPTFLYWIWIIRDECSG